jgi:hypothetical protein
MLCLNAECHYAEFCILFTIMLNVIMLSVVMLNAGMLSVVAPKNVHFKNCKKVKTLNTL